LGFEERGRDSVGDITSPLSDYILKRSPDISHLDADKVSLA